MDRDQSLGQPSDEADVEGPGYGIQFSWLHPMVKRWREEDPEPTLREALGQAFEEAMEQGQRYGRIQERREMVRRILEWRGIPLGYGAGFRLRHCGCLDLLELWARRALHVTDATELFVEE
ncbi:hypothetical protein [Streptomyces sp. NPDC091215]|uniref:hypothetical protein n=1 Tax=Streptomyces sp. NPDC091215 TaxID=3155192 RepID=UPI003413E05F